jgi:hypothetical protein
MTASEAVENLDGTRTEYFDVKPEEPRLLALLREVFEEHWRGVMFGPCLQGAVFELRFLDRPTVSYLDGYLTIGPGEPQAWHFHLCVGAHTGSPARPTPPALAEWRRCGRAAFYRDFDAMGTCGSWGFRMWNGRGEQMITIFFPNPWLDPARGQYLATPDWGRLELWMRLRERYAGIAPEAPPAGSPPPTMH